VTKIPFDNLPDQIQKEYKYDRARVAASLKAAEEAKKTETARAAAAQRERERIALQAEQERRQQEEKRLAVEQRKKNIDAMVSMLLFIVGLAVAVTFYFVPSIVGLHKNNAVAIFVLNFFLGWTFVGWVLALVWA
jgi:cation transport ATPase